MVSKSTCPNGLFHGASSEMEVQNAVLLFRRALDMGFVYLTYCLDGDAKVFKEVIDIYFEQFGIRVRKK